MASGFEGPGLLQVSRVAGLFDLQQFGLGKAPQQIVGDGAELGILLAHHQKNRQVQTDEGRGQGRHGAGSHAAQTIGQAQGMAGQTLGPGLGERFRAQPLLARKERQCHPLINKSLHALAHDFVGQCAVGPAAGGAVAGIGQTRGDPDQGEGSHALGPGHGQGKRYPGPHGVAQQMSALEIQGVECRQYLGHTALHAVELLGFGRGAPAVAHQVHSVNVKVGAEGFAHPRHALRGPGKTVQQDQGGRLGIAPTHHAQENALDLQAHRLLAPPPLDPHRHTSSPAPQPRRERRVRESP